MNGGMLTYLARKLFEGELLSLNSVVPSGPCIYAFWLKETALSETTPKLPMSLINHDGWHLVYIAYSPRSSVTGRSSFGRAISNHFHGSLASSSFLTTMAALLLNILDFQTVNTGKFPKITNTQDLRTWLSVNCLCSIVYTDLPWLYGPIIVKQVNPIMSVRIGKSEFRKEIDLARRKLLKRCGISRTTQLR